MALSRDPGLQNRANRIVERVEIRSEWRPIHFANKIRKSVTEPVLIRFCCVCRCWVLLKRPTPVFKMPMGPRFHHALEDFLPVIFLVDFDALINQNQWSLPINGHPGENHRRSRMSRPCGKSSCSICSWVIMSQNPHVLFVEDFFNCEKILVEKKYCSMSSTTESALQVFRFFSSVPLNFFGEQMRFLYLVGV